MDTHTPHHGVALHPLDSEPIISPKGFSDVISGLLLQDLRTPPPNIMHQMQLNFDVLKVRNPLTQFHFGGGGLLGGFQSKPSDRGYLFFGGDLQCSENGQMGALFFWWG